MTNDHSHKLPRSSRSNRSKKTNTTNAFENGWENLETIPDPLDDEEEQDEVGVPARLTAETTTLPMPYLEGHPRGIHHAI